MQTNNDNASTPITNSPTISNDPGSLTNQEAPVAADSQSAENKVRRRKQRQVCCEDFTYAALLALIGEIQQGAHLGPQGYINLLLFRYLLHKKREEAEARRKEKEEQEAKALAKSARKNTPTDLSTLPGTPSKSSAHGHR